MIDPNLYATISPNIYNIFIIFTQLDIREASNEIRYAYKTYFNLKSAALEASFQNIDGFDSEDDENSSSTLNTPNISTTEDSNNCSSNFNASSTIPSEESNFQDSPTVNTNNTELTDNVNSDKTWGNHLNNKPETKVTKANKFDASSSFTKKLFKNSNPSKRNLRKSISFHHRNSDTSLNVSGNSSFSFSQPTTSCMNDTSMNDDSFSVVNMPNSENLRVTKPIEPVRMNSLNVVQAVLDEKFSTVRNVDAGWMKRVAVSAGTKMVNRSLSEGNFALSHQLYTNQTKDTADHDSDEIIGDSDEDEDSKLHFSKRRKLNHVNHVNTSVIQPIELTPTQPIETKHEEVMEVEENVKPAIVKPEIKTKPIVDKIVDKVEIPSRKSTRNRKTLVSLDLNDPDDEQDPFANDEDEDPDFIKDSTTKHVEDDDDEGETQVKVKKKSLPKKKSQPKKQPKEKKQIEEQVESTEEEKTYELEFSIKPRRVTVPRDTNFKNVLKKSKSQPESSKPKEPQMKTAQQQKMEKLEQKIKSGNLNDNFVRINLEKKTYSRGKKSINFSKYKKKLWKQNKAKNALCGPDMDMRGCDGGHLTCFNCGKVGHFAEKCPMQKEDGLLPLPAGEENFCPYPTLEEASEMAKGQLAIRRTRQDDKQDGGDAGEVDKTDNQEDEQDDDENEDDSSEDNENIDNNMFSDNDDDDLLAETLRLEEYVKKVDQQQFIDDSRVIKPYYNTNEDGSIIPTPQEVFDVLEMFGHSSFRGGQEKAIMRILSGQSTLVTLSTGSGKSLCYQLPAYLLTKREPCIALVISPLVSLMEDQVTGIPKFLKAECLHTNKTKVQKERILNAISTGDLHILLVSPEAVVAGEKQTGFGSLLRKLPPVAFACIDEAHCVSQWSHNFRPSYLMICSILKERLGVKTILGLTATATRATSDSIISHLSIPDGRNGIISDIPLPNNLRLTVSKDGNRDNALLNLVLSERFENLKSIIVYCTRRQECERIASLLRTSLMNENHVEVEEGNKRKRKKLKVQAEPYHAGLPASKRRSIQNSFMRGDLRIVVATVAFGEFLSLKKRKISNFCFVII